MRDFKKKKKKKKSYTNKQDRMDKYERALKLKIVRDIT